MNALEKLIYGTEEQMKRSMQLQYRLSKRYLSEEIECIKCILNDESVEYLTALLNAEVSIFNQDNIDTRVKDCLMDFEFFEPLIIYNIYHRLLKLIGDKVEKYKKENNTDRCYYNLYFRDRQIFGLDYKKDSIEVFLGRGTFMTVDEQIKELEKCKQKLLGKTLPIDPDVVVLGETVDGMLEIYYDHESYKQVRDYYRKIEEKIQKLERNLNDENYLARNFDHEKETSDEANYILSLMLKDINLSLDDFQRETSKTRIKTYTYAHKDININITDIEN